MAKLIYAPIASLDQFVEDEQGDFDWAADVRDDGLLGTAGTGGDQPALIRDRAEIWRAAEKIVYSRTRQTVFQRQDSDRAGARGRLELTAERRFRSGVVHLHYRVCG